MWVLTLSPSYNRRNWGTEETGPKLETRCSPAAPKTQWLWAQGFAFSLCLPFFCFIHFLSSSFFSQKTCIDIRDTWHVLKPFRLLLASPSPVLIMHTALRESNHVWFYSDPEIPAIHYWISGTTSPKSTLEDELFLHSESPEENPTGFLWDPHMKVQVHKQPRWRKQMGALFYQGDVGGRLWRPMLLNL